MLKAFIFFMFLLIYSSLYAQNVVSELGGKMSGIDVSDMLTEKIYKISASGRIYILTNTNEILVKGDFISIIHNKDLVFRALVAKAKSNFLGIKIVKIYDQEKTNKLRPRDQVQIIRGDDSYYRKEKENANNMDGQIQSEDNLFDKTFLDEDLSMEENTKRIIKQDNIISVSYAMVEGVDSDGSSQRFGQFNGQWAYQFMDNVWAEIGYGQHQISDFPDDGLDSNVYSLTFRIKYTFAGPFYSYLKPYFGYQIIKASDTSDIQTTQQQLDLESKLYDRTEKGSPAIGVTILKRLVPGWFLRANLGSDLLAMGFSLEF